MLHLIYYLNCLAKVDDVRIQNREAFELTKLAERDLDEIILSFNANYEKQ